MWWKIVFSNLSRKFFQCILAIRKISVCLPVSCNTPRGSSIQQSQGESFIKFRAYKENAQCESERAVANARIACWLFEVLLNPCPRVGGPSQRDRRRGCLNTTYNSIIFI